MRMASTLIAAAALAAGMSATGAYAQQSGSMERQPSGQSMEGQQPSFTQKVRDSQGQATVMPDGQSQAGVTRGDMRALQQALNEAGHDVGQVDGVMGPKTSEAIRSYQEEKGLQPTGKPDSATMQSLGVQARAGSGMPEQGITAPPSRESPAPTSPAQQ